MVGDYGCGGLGWDVHLSSAKKSLEEDRPTSKGIFWPFMWWRLGRGEFMHFLHANLVFTNSCPHNPVPKALVLI